MDDPLWYSKINILDRQTEDGTWVPNEWVDANGRTSIILNDKDALKIIHEDGVPTSPMLVHAEGPGILFGTEDAFDIREPGGEDGCVVGSAVVGYAHVGYHF